MCGTCFPTYLGFLFKSFLESNNFTKLKESEKVWQTTKFPFQTGDLRLNSWLLMALSCSTTASSGFGFIQHANVLTSSLYNANAVIMALVCFLWYFMKALHRVQLQCYSAHGIHRSLHRLVDWIETLLSNHFRIQWHCLSNLYIPYSYFFVTRLQFLSAWGVGVTGYIKKNMQTMFPFLFFCLCLLIWHLHITICVKGQHIQLHKLLNFIQMIE